MEGLIMNSKKDYNSFFSFLLGKELLTKKVYIEDKKLVMYCTGGIRFEKASAILSIKDLKMYINLKVELSNIHDK